MLRQRGSVMTTNSSAQSFRIGNGVRARVIVDEVAGGIIFDGMWEL